MNVRIPERAMGDLRAQIAAVQTGEKRFLELVAKYGRDTVLGAIGAIMDQSEAAARASVRTIPDGVYEAESFLDDDGVDAGRRVPIRVKVTVDGRPDDRRPERRERPGARASTTRARRRVARARRSRSSA